MQSILTSCLVAAVLLVGWQQRALPVSSLETREHEDFGRYLTDQTGQPLYIFSADKPDKTGSAKSNCYDMCSRTWQPVKGTPQVDAGVNKKLISSFVRKDGQQQLSYNGWPLYYYSVDIGASAYPSGNGKISEGGTWSLIRPNGSMAVELH